MRALETEQATLHDQVRKWMRRAIAAERAAERNQEPDPKGPETPATPAPVVARPLWGARARRIGRIARPDPVEELVNQGATNGVHP